MYFLLEACENPGILRALYFGLIIKDIIFTIIPVALVGMMIIDFSKAIVSGDAGAQTKIVNLIPKRIMYAVIIFILPWGIHIFMKTLGALKLSVGTDYNECIKNARTGDFSEFDKLLEEEEEAEKIIKSIDNSGSNNDSSNIGNSNEIENIKQCNQSWSNTKLKGTYNKNGKATPRNICSSGCGFCSFTMVLRSFGFKNGTKELTPDVVVNQIFDIGYGNNGTASPYDFMALSSSNKYKYNLKSSVDTNNGKWFCASSSKEELNKMFSKYKQYLKEGKRLIINIPGHYISVLGIESDGTLHVTDSSSGLSGSRYWRGYDTIGPYSMVPSDHPGKEDFANNDILRSNDKYVNGVATGYGKLEVDLSAYRNISKKGKYTLETLFYITTYSYTKYSSVDGEKPCWKNITSIWKE